MPSGVASSRILGEFITNSATAHSLGSKFRVLNFFKPFVTDFCQPAVERLGFRRWNRLNQPKQLFGISNISQPHFPSANSIFKA